MGFSVYLCHALHSTNFRGTIEPKKFAKSTSKEHTKGNWYKRTSGFESFLWEKKLKKVLRSFARDSSTWFVGVRWLLFCLYPNSEPCTLHIAEIFRFFPEVALLACHQRRKIHGASSFSWETYIQFWKVARSELLDIFFKQILTINLETAPGRRWRQGRMVVRNFRRQWCQELRQ